MTRRLNFIIIILAFGLAACTGQVPTTAPSMTPTASASPQPTSTIIATPTTVIPTLTPAPTQTIEPTLDEALMNFATQIALCNADHSFESKTSPDGKWVATDCDDGNIFRLHIVRVDATKAWQVSFKDITGYDSYGATNQFGEYSGFPSIPVPFHWYKDSRYLFIAPQVIVDGNQSDGEGLYRFDTQTGRYAPFLPVGESSYNISFSPDDEYYVYSYGMDNKYIHIASLETGEEKHFQLPTGQGYSRHFLWSLDSTKFVFVYDDETTKKSALLLFDTVQKTYTTLLEIDWSDSYNLSPIEWVSNSQVKIWKEQSYYLLNIETKELQPISTKQAP